MAKALVRVCIVLTTNLTLILLFKYIGHNGAGKQSCLENDLMEDVPCVKFTELSDEFRAEAHDIGNGQTIPMVYLITTTYRRETQKADLVVLCQTLMHVQSLVWILVENSMQHTPMIGALLKRCGLPYVHLTVSSPDYTYVRATSEIVGIQHRNVGLKWIREHCGYGKCNSGVVYFGDDDDRYDLRLFDKIRNTVTISVFMVGLTGGLLMEGPYCKKGKLQKWHHVWGNSRHIPVDMQGFAINLRLVLKHADIWLEGSDTYNSMGYIEASRFISRFLPHTTLYCGTYNDEVLVWRSRTMQPETFRECYNRSNRSMEF